MSPKQRKRSLTDPLVVMAFRTKAKTKKLIARQMKRAKYRNLSETIDHIVEHYFSCENGAIQ